MPLKWTWRIIINGQESSAPRFEADASGRDAARRRSAGSWQVKGRDRTAARHFATNSVRYSRREAAGKPGNGFAHWQAARQRPGTLDQSAARLRSRRRRTRARRRDQEDSDVAG